MQEGGKENCVEKMCWRAGESSTGCAGGLEGVKRLFYWQVKALFLSEGRRKSLGAGDSVWGLTGALEGGGMTR